MRGGGTDGIAGITGKTVVRLLLPLEVRVDHVRTQSARTDRKVSAIPTEEELVTPTELQIVLSGSRDQGIFHQFQTLFWHGLLPPSLCP